MMRKIVIANWKMNFDLHQTASFLRNFLKLSFNKKIIYNKEIIIAPSLPFLHISNQIIKGTSIKISAQNIFFMDKGPYTGEVSASMLKSMGIEYVIIGHSERRINFFENDEILLKKIKIAIKNKLKIIFCLGETYNERNENKHFISIKNQLSKTIFNFSLYDVQYFYIAYEPIWAIGTGISANSDHIQMMHQFIRSLFSNKYGESFSKKIPIIYGGSINLNNAKSIFSIPNVNGGLIGNSSLKIEQFLKIVQS
ncbi:triose-phosphate isomerase [Blattabacterium cuenoti]|uniref:triose-phosphate isomerase n=1 Tax=Blattabacterium cuenoti TaxID=1653831 RepID=UPI00163CAD80|nr:triose-phosphate isomerase [Blattabacterium cuenoti]